MCIRDSMQTKRIEARPTAAALYGTALRERGELTEQQERDIRKDLWAGMEQAYLQMKENSADSLLPATAQDADETPIPRTSIRTGISPELFQRIGNILTELPDGFTPLYGGGVSGYYWKYFIYHCYCSLWQTDCF